MGWFEERFQNLHNRLQSNCIVCDRPMWFPKSKHGKYKTCGDECSSLKFVDQIQSRKRNCLACSAEFFPRLYQLKNKIGIYCSQKCNEKSHNALNSQESQAKSKASWKIRNSINPIVKKGSLNPKWKGGRKASYLRQVQAGARSKYRQFRKDRDGKRASRLDVFKLGNYQKWHCAICKTSLKNKKYEVDHINPVFRGGKTEFDNLQLLCVPCNRTKSYKDPIVFMQQKGYLL